MESLVNISNKFWKDKRVLITGYEGFLGSHLTKALQNYGAKIWGLDILTRREETILTKGDYNKIAVIKGSVAKLTVVDKVIKDYRIEVIFHLAAEAIVEECWRNPLNAFLSNIKGTWNILESSRKSKTVNTIIIASSDKAYGSHKKLPYTEDAPLAGNYPYDVSKSCADLLAYTYFRTYRVPVLITRCGNIFGPGDFNSSRIVPEAIRSIMQNKTLIIRSDGKFIRDYVYVDDIVRGYILLAQKGKKMKLFGEAFNFSNENPISVLDLVKKIYKIVNKKPNYKIFGKVKYEIKDQYLSSKKAREILGWEPKCTLEEGLQETIKWYKDNLG